MILCTGLAVAGAIAYSFTATKQYSATAQLLVQPQNGTLAFAGTPAQTITPTDVATELQLLTSAPVVDAVKSRLHLSQLNVKGSPAGADERDLGHGHEPQIPLWLPVWPTPMRRSSSTTKPVWP